MKNNKLMKMGGVFLAAAVMFTGVWAVEQKTGEDTAAIPQIVEFVDTADGSVIVLEEEVPLASKPIVKTKTTTKKSVQKKKLNKKAKKSKKTTTRRTTKRTTNQESSTLKVKTDTTVLTTVQAATKKNSKIETVTTTVKTTVQTTTTNKPKPVAAPVKTSAAPAASKNTTTTTTTAASSNKTSTVYNVAIRNIAPKANENVLAAYELMGFTTEINPTVSYAGYFGVQAHKIILQEKNGTAVYHELGHFVGWIAGNVDLKSEFVTIYNSEKSKLTGSNSAYLTKNSSEYFAESYREYVVNKAALQASRPKTYAYIESSLAKITTARATTIKTAYQNSYWA